MIRNLSEHLTGIALGVRFRPNFSLEDKLGEIVDSILYSKDSLFDQKIFPEVNYNIGTKTLMNKDNNNKLVVDYSNIVLEIGFEENSGFEKNDTNDIIEAFRRQIINGVLKQHHVQDIIRTGYIQRHIFNIEGLAQLFINKTLGDTVDGVKEISLKFTKKLPLALSLVKQDVNDYDNVIYTVNKRSNESSISIAMDYQSFSDPYLENSESINFHQFIHRANNYSKNNFLTWINSYYKEVLFEKAI